MKTDAPRSPIPRRGEAKKPENACRLEPESNAVRQRNFVRGIPLLVAAVIVSLFFAVVHSELHERLTALSLTALQLEAELHTALLAENLDFQQQRLGTVGAIAERYLAVERHSAEQAVREFGWDAQAPAGLFLLSDNGETRADTRITLEQLPCRGCTILLAHPLHNPQGEVLGLLATRYSFDEQIARFQQVGSTPALLTRNGTVVGGPLAGSFQFPVERVPNNATSWKGIFTFGNVEYLGAWISVPGTEWAVATVGTEDALPISPQKVHTLLIATWVGFMLLLLYLWLRTGTVARYKTLSERDHLTGVGNRLAFEQDFKRQKTAAGLPLSLLMLDVDGLKGLNDALGHEAGDALLRRTAQLLHTALRSEDAIYRVGGDEFAVILGQTSQETAQQLRVRIREFAQRSRQNPELPPLSLSLGLAAAVCPENLDDLYRRADEDMYEEKERHREPFRLELAEWLKAHPRPLERRSLRNTATKAPAAH